PHMQVVVIEIAWHQGLMPFHRTVKALAKERGVLFHARREWDKPLGADQAEFVAHRLVQEGLRTHRVWHRADELWVKEVDTHPSRGILDTPHRRKVAVADGCDRITILHSAERTRSSSANNFGGVSLDV